MFIKTTPVFGPFALSNEISLSYQGHDLSSVVCALRRSSDVRIISDQKGPHTRYKLYPDSVRGCNEVGDDERLVGQYHRNNDLQTVTFAYVHRQYNRDIMDMYRGKKKQNVEERSFTVFPKVIEPNIFDFLFDLALGGYTSSSNGLRTGKSVPSYIKGTRLVVDSNPLFGLNYDRLRRRLSIYVGESENHLDQGVVKDGNINKLLARIGKSLDKRVVELLDHGVSLLKIQFL